MSNTQEDLDAQQVELLDSIEVNIFINSLQRCQLRKSENKVQMDLAKNFNPLILYKLVTTQEM